MQANVGRQNGGRFFACAVYADARAIRLVKDFDGGRRNPRKCRPLARDIVKDDLRRHRGWSAAFYPLKGFEEDGKVVLGASYGKAKDANTRRHEEVHAKAAEEFPRAKWQGTLPLEESIAYAIADCTDVTASPKLAADRIPRLSMYSFEAMRFMQCIAHEVNSNLLAERLSAALRDANKWNRNIAHAFDQAADLLFYRECVKIIERFGLKKGEDVLFEALRLAHEEGLHEAYEFLLKRLRPRVRQELAEGIALPGRPIRVASPYSPSCEVEEVALKDYY